VHPVGGEEGVGQRDPAHDRAADVALVPLVAGHCTEHGHVALEDALEADDALTGPGVHLVGHGRGADLTGDEALGGEVVAGHQAKGRGQAGRAGRRLGQRGDHFVVQRPGVHLTHAGERRGEAEVAPDGLLQAVQGLGVPPEQVELVLGGAHRPLQAPQGQVTGQGVHPSERAQDLLAGVGEALAQRRHLGRDVVAPTGERQVVVLEGPLGQPGQHGHQPVPDQLQAGADLQELDVLGQVPRRHRLVGVLVTRQCRELLDPRLHVVTGDPLAGGNRVEVDGVDHGSRCVDRLGGDVHTELALGLHDRDPEAPLEPDLVLGGEQLGHRGAGVPLGEHVADHLPIVRGGGALNPRG